MKRYIDVSKWLYGAGAGETWLHRASDGKQCCLGQWGAAAGIPIDILAQCRAPSDLIDDGHVLYTNHEDYFDTFVEHEDGQRLTDPTDYAREAMSWNDRLTDPSGGPLSLSTRMQKIAKIGEQYGDEIIFLNVPDEARCW